MHYQKGSIMQMEMSLIQTRFVKYKIVRAT